MRIPLDLALMCQLAVPSGPFISSVTAGLCRFMVSRLLSSGFLAAEGHHGHDNRAIVLAQRAIPRRIRVRCRFEQKAKKVPANQQLDAIGTTAEIVIGSTVFAENPDFAYNEKK